MVTKALRLCHHQILSKSIYKKHCQHLAIVEAATTDFFHLFVRLWPACAIHENINSADMNARSFKILTGLQARIGRPPRRAKRWPEYK